MNLIWIETLGTNARLLQAAARVEPVVFDNYNENKLLQELFGRFEDLAPNHSYCDLLALARALIDIKNPTSKRLFSPTRNLGNYSQVFVETRRS
jgi:hypothetical protein